MLYPELVKKAQNRFSVNAPPHVEELMLRMLGSALLYLRAKAEL
jgi:hypothetical protein